ncbi:MAG: hypothetical protein AABX74_02785 [Nanoarchaeota archaeon]
MKPVDLEKLEDAKVTFGKDAFAPKVMYCSTDNTKMKKVFIDMPVLEFVKVKLNVFRCPKCKEEGMGLDEAKKLDRALIINRLLSKKAVKFKRKLSFDGDNYTFRLPSELTKNLKHKEVEITPLESNEALIQW